MNDYSKMTQEEFDLILRQILTGCSAATLLSIPGIYEVLSEHFNNAVLAAWDLRQSTEDD